MKPITLAFPALISAIAYTLAGCGGGATKVVGKVIGGNISFVGVVDSSDARLKGDGIVGAHLVVRTRPDRDAAQVGQATSGPKGEFTIPVSDSAALLQPAEFTAEKEGYLRASTVMNVPPVDKRVLVILRSAPGTGK